MEQVHDNQEKNKKLPVRKDDTFIVFKKPIFDTKIHYYYFTEIRK